MSQLRAYSLAAALAWSWLALLLLLGLLAPWLPLPYPAGTPDLGQVAAAPSWHGPAPHYLGTDPLGRDVLAGVVAGARRLLLLSLPAAALATVAGAAAGGAAGYWGNRGLRLPLAAALLLVLGGGGALQLPWWLLVLLAALLAARSRRGRLPLPLDSTVLSLTALLGAVPRLVLVLALATGPALGNWGLLGLLALLAWPDTARLVRTQMLQVRALPFVEAAQALGLPPARVWARHALPAACQPLRAQAPLTLAALIGLENTLAFLGAPAGGGTASWGELLGQLRQDPAAWWLLLGPGTALLATLLALQWLARRPG